VFAHLVPIAILTWAIPGVAVGLIVDLPVFFRVSVLIAAAALPLCSSSYGLPLRRRAEHDERSRE
jgi:hypothetical protein